MTFRPASTTRRRRWREPQRTPCWPGWPPKTRRHAPSRDHARGRGGQPEGRGRQDHLDGERRRRPRQLGQRVLVLDLDPQGNASTALGAEHRRGVPSTYDALVDGDALAEIATPADGWRTCGWCPRPSTWPARRSSWSAGGPREPAGEGAGRPPRDRQRGGGRRGAPRLRPDRLPALAGTAHPQRPGRRRRGDDPDPGGVLRARGARTAPGDHRDGQGPPEPAPDGLDHPDHHVRRPHPAGGGRRRRGPRALRRPGPQDHDPALGARLGGAVVRADCDDLRPCLPGSAVLPGGGARSGRTGDNR